MIGYCCLCKGCVVMKSLKETGKMMGIALALSYVWFCCAFLSSCTASAALHWVLLAAMVLVVFACCVLVFFIPVFRDFGMNLLLVILSFCLFCIHGFLFLHQSLLVLP